MSATAERPQTIPVRAFVIAYGGSAIAILIYLTWWPVGLHTILTRHLPIPLHGPLWTYPFNDFDAVLRAIACARQGVDVTLPNACMYGGLFQYSPLLLKAAALPIGPGWREPLGLGQGAVFLLSLFALPHPRRWGEFWCLLLAALSYSTLWALSSANIDTALYLLVLLAAHLLLRGGRMRAAGYVTIVVAAAIKFYPASLLMLAAHERPARFVPMALAVLAAAALLAVAFAGQLGHILPRLPSGSPFGGNFGATNLPDGLALALYGDNPDCAGSRAIRLLLLLGLLVLCAMMARRRVPTLLPALRTMAPRQRMLLLAGAVTMTFCFLTARNVLYRQIFLILTLPAFWDLQGRAADSALRVRAGLACCVVVGLMWSDFFQNLSVGTGARPDYMAFWTVWIMREVLWWWLTGLFAAIILCFLWDAPGLAPVLARWRETLRTRNAG